ncbi:hypothetical protein JB92DRAFT_2914836 [Gautieria morchelliformis]|nr:hypothetical protein JB92DRAFT_2914836 [Gautieria morchelliformis]
MTSMMAFMGAGFVAGICWFVLIKTQSDDNTFAHLTQSQKTAFGVVGGVYTLIALASLFGFIGSVIRRRSFVALYSTMCYIIFFIQCAASGYLIYSLFHATSVNGATCQVVVNGQTENCVDLSKKTKIFVIVFLVIELLIQAYIVAVIHRYVKQLDEEQSYHRTSGHVDTAFNMGPTNAYYPHQPLDQNQGLLAPKGHYAYSDPHHSFGH